MKFRDRTTAELYTLPELQRKFSTVSFPNTWDSTTFEFTNTDPVVSVPEPLPSTPCMQSIYGGIQQINNQWTEVWTEGPLHSDPQQQTVCEEELVESERDRARNKRNILLAETDYTQLSDTPVTVECRDAFKLYRQTLRDINFNTSSNIVWPSAPIYEKE